MLLQCNETTLHKLVHYIPTSLLHYNARNKIPRGRRRNRTSNISSSKSARSAVHQIEIDTTTTVTQ